MLPVEFSWPDGKSGALTTSWDDGTIHDRRLVEILNRHGLKGTFNLNSGKFGLGAAASGWKPYISADEVATLYAGHEVASHTVSHPWLGELPDDLIRAEVREDRRALEALVGYPVTGFVLPYGHGRNDPRVLRLLRECGCLYSRHTQNNGHFDPPADFLDWGVTCHHIHPELSGLWDKFLAYRRRPKIFYLWGHSYEFDDQGNWNLLEDFAARAAAHRDTLWFATNGQIHRYLTAWGALRWSTDLSLVENPSGTALTVRAAGRFLELAPGAVTRLA